jgi:para-nitrobenzyl esterase
MHDLIVETTCGAVRGERHGDVAIWKGIPYAAAAVGALRFRPPAPPVPWSGVRDATEFGAVAAQSRDPRLAMMSGVTDKIASGEDCLFVNVFAPAEPGPPRPVMVWIHGGAFVMGSGSTPLYHGHTFAAQHGIVVVTLNYRLGLPGVLYLGELAPGYDAGNAFLLDQIAALAWVRDNIAAFGGDPGSVTAMGESAGAIAISMLLAIPAARGLFHRAILESGGPALGPPSRADATALAREVVRELGASPGASPGASGDAPGDLLAEVPLDRLLAVQDRIAQARGLSAFAPYIDGVTVPRPPIELVRDGAAAGIPILLGTNHDEWNLFEVLFGEVTVEPFHAIVRDALGPLTDRLLDIYRDNHRDRSLQRAWVDLVGELVFRIPAIRLAEAQSAHAPVYMYRFDWKSPAFGGRLGAGHALELPFVWNRLDLPMAPILLGTDLTALQPLATAMHNTWAQFIRTGDPNGAGLPHWPHYHAEHRATLLIDRDSRVVDDPGATARLAWPAAWPR